jgi:hypothetical protein
LRLLLRYSLTTLLLAGLCPALSAGEETGLSRKHHPWGCFEVGAWTRVRVVTQTFEQNQTLTTITETTTTLKEISDDGVTLLVESVVDVGGKRLRSDPQTVKQGWHGELASQDVKVTHLDDSEVVIRGRRIPCKVQQLEVVGPASKTTTKIYYSDTVEPFILKRESVSTDLEGKTKLGETTVEVMDVDVPCRILASIRNTFHVKAVHKSAKGGTTTTIAFTSTRVPGGVIRNDSKEYDASGRLVRQSTLELLDYGLEAEEERDEALGPWRPVRPRRLQRLPPYRLRLPPPLPLRR